MDQDALNPRQDEEHDVNHDVDQDALEPGQNEGRDMDQDALNDPKQDEERDADRDVDQDALEPRRDEDRDVDQDAHEPRRDIQAMLRRAPNVIIAETYANRPDRTRRTVTRYQAGATKKAAKRLGRERGPGRGRGRGGGGEEML